MSTKTKKNESKEAVVGEALKEERLLKLWREIDSLEKQKSAIEAKRLALFAQARRLIGFEHPEAADDIEEELCDYGIQTINNQEALIEYAIRMEQTWELEEAVRTVKELAEVLKRDPVKIIAEAVKS